MTAFEIIQVVFLMINLIISVIGLCYLIFHQSKK